MGKVRETFILPDFTSLMDSSGLNSSRVVIVAIVGKSPLGSYGIKAKSIGRVFPISTTETLECSIEGCYDDENQIVYLHLHSLLDTDLLIRHLEQNKCDDFLVLNEKVKSSFARALCFLLHCSHIVILSHPGSTFDTNYIQYFKAVDTLSQKLNSRIVEELRSLDDLSIDWIENGRLCTPRFIFYFSQCPVGAYNLKKVEHNLEDRIYHVLKKTRIISNYKGNSLFAIPMNEEFVYMAADGSTDPLGDAVRGLIQDCQPGGAATVQAPFCSQPYSERNFVKFLQVHVRQARNKGFNDTSSSNRNVPQTHFELPVLRHWIDSTEILYSLIMTGDPLNSLCTDTRFSEQRCLKVLPLAVARYQDNLPPHYALVEHERRLGSALALFNAQARGPAFLQYVAKLQSDCKAHWENGRQQCEAASMTGNPCKLPKHTSSQEHMSGFVYKSVCDCGRKIAPRDDPYSAKQANEAFYQQISCACAKLDRITFPVFQPSIKEFKAATLKDTEEALSEMSDRSTNESTPEHDHERSLVRQPSTTEYLPGMLTLASPPGLLPAYSSWSLVCLGPSSLYSHNLGLSDSYHPGFLSSTNYLLPWDVTVYSKSKSWAHKYPSRGRRGRTASTGVSPQFSVKVFIGVEYECSSGHRFMLAAPDKILKANPGSIVKDTGHKIAESDMPLYHPCMCRANKMAQLMRLHVVTPKAPVNCTLDPKVQPAPGAPIFISTAERPIKLTQSAYWVMRLPYVYVADKEHYQQNLGAKLLQGVFGVTEME